MTTTDKPLTRDGRPVDADGRPVLRGPDWECPIAPVPTATPGRRTVGCPEGLCERKEEEHGGMRHARLDEIEAWQAYGRLAPARQMWERIRGRAPDGRRVR